MKEVQTSTGGEKPPDSPDQSSMMTEVCIPPLKLGSLYSNGGRLEEPRKPLRGHPKLPLVDDRILLNLVIEELWLHITNMYVPYNQCS